MLQILRQAIFLFDLYKHIPNTLNSTSRLFADNTCGLIYQSNQAALTEETNRELANVHEWAQANKIAVNSQKFSSLVILPKTTSNICT